MTDDQEFQQQLDDNPLLQAIVESLASIESRLDHLEEGQKITAEFIAKKINVLEAYVEKLGEASNHNAARLQELIRWGREMNDNVGLLTTHLADRGVLDEQEWKRIRAAYWAERLEKSLDKDQS